jgi:membrane protein insertase Oxa1/YidC/SpoIIIJ
MPSPNGNSEVERLKLEAEAKAMRSAKPTFNPITNCRDLYRGWNQPKPHPQTGDMINLGERITWRIMGVYRKWTVFIALQVLTIVWWTNPHLFPGGLVGWNLLWSDLAVMVEMIVGIAFMAQSMRDAKVIRSEMKELQEAHTETHELLQNRAADFEMLRDIHDALVPGGEGKVVVRDGRLELHSDSPSDEPTVS